MSIKDYEGADKNPASRSYKGKLGGPRPGSGRKKGALTIATLEKLAVKSAMQQRIMRSVAPIVNAQLNLARGVSFLYVIRTDKKGNRSKPELVEDQTTIEAYLAGELENSNEEYYYISTKEPNNEAIKNLLDRAFDKPSEPKDINVSVNFDPYKLAREAEAVIRNTPTLELEGKVIDVEVE